MAAQIAAAPLGQRFMKGAIKALWEVVISRSAKDRILTRHMPVVPDKATGVVGAGVCKALLKVGAKLLGLRIKPVDDDEVLAGLLHDGASIQRLVGCVHCSAIGPMVLSVLQNSGHGDVAFTMAQMGFVLSSCMVVYLVPSAAAVLIWLREDQARVRLEGRAVRETVIEEKRRRAA